MKNIALIIKMMIEEYEKNSAITKEEYSTIVKMIIKI